ncbi:hypothetical protein HCN51_53980 [Nonomuraea sp. FMUSA5-5]|uniref:WXG100 family type VII secretion target n=1 Tax=Nonomuraea composti TaxID=2720023 RepID=A0ABX1BKH6_9ACTN|nr:hypothetical protein [Nonomuraea sp. FMUSA5-5]NJP98243.1 hypothetical protein [Nonomuraea sp. FMUSA5-5]
MAGYEGSVAAFTAALGTASMAAFIMPYAWPVVGLIGMMSGDPQEQDRGAEEWLNPRSVNNWPTYAPATSLTSAQQQQQWHPPMAAHPTPGDQSDLAFLRSELKRLAKEVGDAGDWAGQAYESFIEKVNVLDKHLAALDDNRVGTGNTLKASAQGYNAILMVCVAVAAVLAALAVFVQFCRGSLVNAAAGEANAMRAVMKVHEAVSAAFKQHWKLVLKVSLILSAAGVAFNQFTQNLPGIATVKADKPNLIEAKALWDPTTADIVDDPQSKLDAAQLEQPSIMPEFGW